MIVHPCAACGRPMESPESLAGQLNACPACGTLVPVPQGGQPIPNPGQPPPAPSPAPWGALQPYVPPRVPPRSLADKTSPITDFGAFAIGLPVLMSVLTLLFAVFMDDHPRPPIMGVSRGWFLGVPILGASALSAVAGVLLLVTKRMWALVACIVGGFLIVLAYLVVFTLATGIIPLNLLTLALAAGPVLLVLRAPKAIAEIRFRRGAP